MNKMRCEKKEIINQELASIKRKKVVRDKEDFRSCLVSSLPPPIPIPVHRIRSKSCNGRINCGTKFTSPCKKKK